jgi:hypothetical protein
MNVSPSKTDLQHVLNMQVIMNTVMISEICDSVLLCFIVFSTS